MPKRDELELARFLEGAPGAGEGRIYRDLTGPAVYKLEPTLLTAIRCGNCAYISLVLSIPKRPLTWRCPRCARRARLTPPLEVLTAPDPPAPALNRHTRRALLA